MGPRHVSTVQLLLKFLATDGTAVGVIVAAKIGLSKWDVGTKDQTGVIRNVSEKGVFKKTPEMTVQIDSGNPKSKMEFSLYQNQELVEKAKKFSEQGTFVNVKYTKYMAAPWFAAESSRKVLSIEPAIKDAEVPRKSLSTPY